MSENGYEPEDNASASEADESSASVSEPAGSAPAAKPARPKRSKPAAKPKKAASKPKAAAKKESSPKSPKPAAAEPNEGILSPDVAKRMAFLTKALGEAIRLRVLAFVGNGPKEGRYVSEICDHIGQKQPAVSHHLALLRQSQIVDVERREKNNFYTLTASGRALNRCITVLAKELAP